MQFQVESKRLCRIRKEDTFRETRKIPPPTLWKKKLYAYVLSYRQKASQSEKGTLYSTVQYTPRYPAPFLCLPVMKRGEKGNIFFLPRVRGGGGGGGGLTGAFEREGGQEIIQSRKRREKPANVALSPLSLNILYSRGKKIAHISLSSFRTHSLKVGGGDIRVISRGGPLSGKSRGGKTCCLRSYGKHFRGGGIKLGQARTVL